MPRELVFSARSTTSTDFVWSSLANTCKSRWGSGLGCGSGSSEGCKLAPRTLGKGLQ